MPAAFISPIILTSPIDRLNLPALRPRVSATRAIHNHKEAALPPVVSIVGKSESGKTTLIEKLIPKLKRLGFRIGIVKHAHHGFDMDRKGKDSYRHRQAGADSVMIASPGQIAMIKTVSGECLDDLVPYFDDVDLLIAEGFKSDNAPKIEVFRSQRHQQPACIDDGSLVAMVSDTTLDVAVPQFAPNDIPSITAFIVAEFLSGLHKSAFHDSKR
jgi:molybdopterin-guanine dinucleotide biosynthesis protein B